MPEHPSDKPCSARMAHGGWCLLPDQHEGDHLGIARKEEPIHPDHLFLGQRVYSPWTPRKPVR